MRRALYASGGVHAAILLWIAVGGDLFAPTPDTEFEVTGVTLMSVEEFEALTQPSAVTPPNVTDMPVAPAPSVEPEAPRVAATEDPPPIQTPPEDSAAPAPDPDPVPVPPMPATEVTDSVAALVAPPVSEPDLPVSPRPTPREAPRVAPTPAPAPEPDVETAPEVVDQPTSEEVADTPTPETPPTAPEEATTEIVTEAEQPASAPLASVRPIARPSRPAPTQTAAPAPEPETPSAPSTEDAVAAAVAAAVAEAASAPVEPSGPPLSSAVREGFRIAVQRCWNVGALSSEALQTTVVVGFDMSRDGVPDGGSIRLVEFTGGSREAAQQAYEAARRAVIRCGAQGFDLPLESYDRWSEVELIFNPNGMRLR
jgi:hypothetical protein